MSTSPAGAGPARQDIDTAAGPAQVRVHVPGVVGAGDARDAASAQEGPSGPLEPRGTLLLGHGAGGGRDAADVLALTALTGAGWTVVLVDQPWRVAGRKVATPPPTLDRAWLEVVEALATGPAGADPASQPGPGTAPDGTPLPRPWVYGGRSAGARVATRTSVTADGTAVAGVAGVLALAFPLHPPGRPERSRADELAGPLAAGLPTLVVQGARDPMGTPEEVRAALAGTGTATLQLHAVSGTHSPSRDLDAVLAHARTFLEGLR